MKDFVVSFFFIFITVLLFGQTETGNIEDYLGDIIDNAPGTTGDNYMEPSSAQLNLWNSTVDFILVDDLVNARLSVSGLNYQITEFTDTSISPSQIFYVLEEKSPQSNYWGTYVFSKTPTRNSLVIQAPHSKFDTNTGKQAVYCFKNTMARALFINGTHRCNSANYSSCSGTTSVCGSNDSYRISDMAHTTTSIFQKTTENVFNAISNSVFIQLHGFGKQSTDPYVIMSNGTRETPTSDYATLIKDALFIEDNSLTFELAHINTSWTRLIGFTNTQGRLINNSSDFCATSATITSGRFIHVEQEKSKLRDDENDWIKMSNALSNVFSSTLSTDDFAVNNEILVYPNPASNRIFVKGENILSVDTFNLLGQKISTTYNTQYDPVFSIDLEKNLNTIYLLKIITGSKVIFKEILVH